MPSCKTCIFNSKCKILQTYIEATQGFLKITKEWGFDIKIDEPDTLAKGCPEYASVLGISQSSSEQDAELV